MSIQNNVDVDSTINTSLIRCNNDHFDVDTVIASMIAMVTLVHTDAFHNDAELISMWLP